MPNIYLDFELSLDPPMLDATELEQVLNEKIRLWNQNINIFPSYKSFAAQAKRYIADGMPDREQQAAEALCIKWDELKNKIKIAERVGIDEDITEKIVSQFSAFFKEDTILRELKKHTLLPRVFQPVITVSVSAALIVIVLILLYAFELQRGQRHSRKVAELEQTTTNLQNELQEAKEYIAELNGEIENLIKKIEDKSRNLNTAEDEIKKLKTKINLNNVVQSTIPNERVDNEKIEVAELTKEAGALAPAVAAKAGESLVLLIKEVPWRFRYCPAGTFTMGSPLSEKDRLNDETQHEVKLTIGFFLAETETTQKQWEAVTGSNPSEFQGAKLPVESVSWNDCQEFIAKLNNINVAPKGYKFALPTEAQWEYACRAGSTTAYCFGDSDTSLGDYAWYANNSGSKTHEVGTKKPNAWGLYDMHGNIWEWCSGWYDDYPAGNVTDPTVASSGSSRVYRGGSWHSNAENCRSANRNDYSPDFRNWGLGLRICLVPQ